MLTFVIVKQFLLGWFELDSQFNANKMLLRINFGTGFIIVSQGKCTEDD